MKFNQKIFSLRLDVNKEKENSAESSNMSPESKNLENEDVSIDDCNKSSGQVPEQTGWYTHC